MRHSIYGDKFGGPSDIELLMAEEGMSHAEAEAYIAGN